MKEKYGFDLFMETSAKTGFNAKELFLEAAKVLNIDYSKFKEGEIKTEEIIIPKAVKKDLGKNNKNKGCC